MNKFKFKVTKESEKTKYPVIAQKPLLYSLRPYFSFRYYHSEHKRYTFEHFERKEFLYFFKRLKELSAYTWGQIFGEHRGFFHAHEINWNETKEKQGFCHLPKDLRGFPAYQFEIFKEARIVGYFNQDNVFKIIWVDRFHEIYPQK